MTAKSVFAPAKVNLTLHVTGKRADGYHLLDSLVVFVDIADHLTFDATSEMSIDVTGPFAKGVPKDQRNLVWQAAVCAGWTGHITLEKNLPHGAGIGGGSADAAAVLRTLGGTEHAMSLGADVRVCLDSCPQRMRGVGDRLNATPELPNLSLLLVNPGIHVSTPQVFKGLPNKINPAMPEAIPEGLTLPDMIVWLAAQRNDLEAPARQLVPQIETVLMELNRDAALARMSGSGSTCFGIFENDATLVRCKSRLEKAYPDWWIQQGDVLKLP